MFRFLEPREEARNVKIRTINVPYKTTIIIVLFLRYNTFIYRGILTYVVYVCSLCVESLQFYYWEGEYRGIPGAHWPDIIEQLMSSCSVGGLVPKSNVCVLDRGRHQ